MVEEKKSSFSNKQIFLFIALLCFFSALLLSILSQLLASPKKEARALYRSKQLLLAARILSYDGHFLLKTNEGSFLPAYYDKETDRLLPSKDQITTVAHDIDILSFFRNRVQMRLTDIDGNLYTFSSLGIDADTYLEENEKSGYAHLRYKLLYIIQENRASEKQKSTTSTPYGYVIPVNGYGLWGPIYGYLGLEANGDTVLGMTWYAQEETPGLGGEIGLPDWQKQFQGKSIFQESKEGEKDLYQAQLGIKVMRGTIEEANLSAWQRKNAVDGIAGATFTVMGVNEALQYSLSPYRHFLIRANETHKENNG